MLYPFVKDMIMPLLPDNVMEAFEVLSKILGAHPVISFEVAPNLPHYLFVCFREVMLLDLRRI